MVRAYLNGNVGRGNIYFLPQKTMMNRDGYLNMMTEKLLHRIDIHRATHFLQDEVKEGHGLLQGDQDQGDRLARK
jgi:hypothetical protein